MAYMKDSKGRRLDSIEIPAVSEVQPSPATKLLGFQAALANRASSPCDILVCADSVGEGVGVSSLSINRWVNQFLIALRQSYPVDGVAGGYGYRPASTTVINNAPVTAGATSISTNGLAHRSVILGAGGSITFTEVCTSFQLRLKRSTTDSLTVSVDGGGATAIAAGPSGEFTYTSAALQRDTHTIVVTQTAGSPEVEGIFAMDGDENAGIRLWDSSKAGAKAGDWTVASGGSEAWLTAATGFTPSLVILGCLLNDVLAVSSATYKTNVANQVAAVRAKWPNVGILLIGSFQPPSRQTGLVSPWANYITALAELAAADARIAFLNLMNRIGSIPTDTYTLLADTTHPNNRGHRLYAQIAYDFVKMGPRDTDIARTSAITVDTLRIDTPASTTPPAPGRGGTLYADAKNGAIIARLGAGSSTNNQLGGSVSTSVNQSWRLGWRYGRITTGSGVVTINLPASGGADQRYTFKKVDAGTGTAVISATTPSGNQQTIEGSITKTLSGQWSTVTVISTGIGTAAGVGWEIESVVGTVS